MSNRYYDTYVYAVTKDKEAYCVHKYLYTVYGDSYRSEIHIKDKYYSVLDLIDGGYEAEGEILPRPDINEWEATFSQSPSENVCEVLKYFELEPSFIDSLVWIKIDSVSAGVCDLEGYIISSEGKSELDKSFFEPYKNGFYSCEKTEELSLDIVNLILENL